MTPRPAVVLSLALLRPLAVVGDDQGVLRGLVQDSTGAVVPGASVSLQDAHGAALRTVTTGRDGRFQVEARPGSYVLLVTSPGFAPRRQAVALRHEASELTLTLHPAAVVEEVTVTASPGLAQSVDIAPQAVNVMSEAELGARAKGVLAQVAAEEVGLHLQRTSPTIAGIFVRGLTGNKVNVFVDGVRYSTSAARGGINTFLDLIDPSSLAGVEVLRGPSSAQYGSDALGGSVQVLTRVPAFSETPHAAAVLSTTFGSADTSFGSNLRWSWSRRDFALDTGIAGRRVNTLRPGGGRDSHNAVTRFLGLSSDVVLDGRLPDTAFTQYGGSFKLAWAPGSGSQLTLSYLRGQQDGGKRYDQLLGGDGNLIADLRNLMLDLGYLRYEKRDLGTLDSLTLTYSFNAQREERVNQGGNGNPRATVSHEYEKTRVHGMQAALGKLAGRHELALGGDVYLETVTAPSFGFNPVTAVSAVRRGRVPDGARFTSGGVYLQDSFRPVPDRLTLAANLRWSAAAYQARVADGPSVGGRPLWPDDALDVSDVTFRLGGVWTPRSDLTLNLAVSRGFRAPHITDLGTLGLTGAGFELAFADVSGLGASAGTTADRSAVSTGEALRELGPETSLDWEAALRYHGSRFDTDLVVFLNDVHDNIAKQALILPAGAVGLTLGDQPITAQTPGGAVFVPASSSPVLVRVNFDEARIWGIEHTARLRLGGDFSIGTVATYLHAADRATGNAPNLEGGTPAPDGWLKLRYAPGGKRFWVEGYVHAAARQSRLSTLDLEDRRTGATRSRSSIASFFSNGARVRGLVGPGADGVPGNADDVLLATGETLAQVQDRVLGPGVGSAPLSIAVPGYVMLGLRGGASFGTRHELLVDLENLTDRNYRGISWGVDAPGFGVFVRWTLRL